MFVRGGYWNFLHQVEGVYVDTVLRLHWDKIAEMLEDGEIYGFCYFGNY